MDGGLVFARTNAFFLLKAAVAGAILGFSCWRFLFQGRKRVAVLLLPLFVCVVSAAAVLVAAPLLFSELDPKLDPKRDPKRDPCEARGTKPPCSSISGTASSPPPCMRRTSPRRR